MIGVMGPVETWCFGVLTYGKLLMSTYSWTLNIQADPSNSMEVKHIAKAFSKELLFTMFGHA
jgi:hypothetical protein